MIAKIVTHGADRNSALQLLRQALAETQVGWTWHIFCCGTLQIELYLCAAYLATKTTYMYTRWFV